MFFFTIKAHLIKIFFPSFNEFSVTSFRPGNHNAFRVIFTRNSFHYAHYAFGDDFTRNAITKLHISDRRGFHNCLPDSKLSNSSSIESFLTRFFAMLSAISSASRACKDEYCAVLFHPK